MVTGVVVGVLGLAEALPHTAGAAAVRLASWVCMLLGVAGEQSCGSVLVPRGSLAGYLREPAVWQVRKRRGKDTWLGLHAAWHGRQAEPWWRGQGGGTPGKPCCPVRGSACLLSWLLLLASWACLFTPVLWVGAAASPCPLSSLALLTCLPACLPARPPAVLANGAGGTRELAAVVLSKLPAGVWKALPVRCGGVGEWGSACRTGVWPISGGGRLFISARCGPLWHALKWTTAAASPFLPVTQHLTTAAAPADVDQPLLHSCSCLCSVAVRMKSWATHRVELPELAVPESLAAAPGTHKA